MYGIVLYKWLMNDFEKEKINGAPYGAPFIIFLAF